MGNYKKLLRTTIKELNKGIFGTRKGIGVATAKFVNNTIGRALEGKNVNIKGISRISYNIAFSRNVFTRKTKRQVNRGRRVAKV
jgi:hypothetical protein